MEDTVRQSYSFQEACDSLGLTSQAMWRLLREYREILKFSEQEPEASSRFMSADAVETARLITGFLAAGYGKEQVVERINLRRLSRGESPESVNAMEMLLSRVEALEQELAESERRRAEDRDRLFTALARTQQELQRLKNDIVVAASRRNRDQPLLKRLLSD